MIHYVLSGTGTMRLGATSAEVSRDACVYFPGRIPHATESLGTGPLRYLYAYACECLGPDPDWRPSDEGAASRAALSHKTWMRWEETADWRPIEPEKGLKVRYRRVMDPEKKVELIAGIAEFDPGVHYTRHYHDQPELYYILAGRGVVYVGDSEVEVSPGSSVYMGGRVVHGADSLGAESLRLLYVYACETAGHTINWTPVEDIYTEARRR
jgi:mannose-6-phosphate isomerase-like protein (cupin superfamily)